MEPKEFDFEFPRGDTLPISFNLTDADGKSLDLSSNDTEIYFTLKENYNTAQYIIQKKKTTGDISVEDTNVSFVINHNDTAKLKYGNYVYDISFKSGDFVKTLFIGKITLTNESTFIENE